MLNIWKKCILLYFKWNFEASNFEIGGDIFHLGRLSDTKILRIGFHKTYHFFRFQRVANIPSYVFHTFCLIYPALSDPNFLSIGFHKTCHFFRFQGIADISSYVFHTFCLIYPALSDEKILSIGFHQTCHFFRFQGIANIPSFVFHTFCLIYPAMSEDLYFFEKVNSQNFIHCTDPVLRPGLKPQVKRSELTAESSPYSIRGHFWVIEKEGKNSQVVQEFHNSYFRIAFLSLGTCRLKI